MLTKEQQEAIKIQDTPLIIVAGPGTGKTTLITQKILNLINSGINPDEILAITFTQKAAEELTSRIESELNSISNSFQGKTFHSFAIEIIEKYKSFLPNLSQDFDLIDETNQLLFFLENIDNFKLNSIEIKDKLEVARGCVSIVSKLKDFGYSLNNLESLNIDLQTKVDLFSIISKYEQFKRELNLIDFGDLMLYLKELLSNKSLQIQIQENFKYILVDEFQDTNLIQLEIINLLSKNNITIVGDKKQSIYGFRGANYSNFDLFKKSKQNSKLIYLKENFRCSKNVLEQVNKITLNISSKEEVLNPNSNVSGIVELVESKNEFCELGFLVEKIKDLQSLGSSKTIGILTRRKSEAKTISEALNLAKINHHSPQINSFLLSNLVQDLINILRFLDSPKEDSISLFKILEDLDIRAETLKSISRKSSLNEKSLYQVIKSSDKFSDFEDENNKLLDLKSKLSFLLDLKSAKLSISGYILKVIEKFNLYQKALISENVFEIESLNSFLKFSKSALQTSKDKTLSRFLFIINLNKNVFLEENDLIKHKVELLTIHNSKGKEFDHVFIPFLNDRKFPTSFKKSLFEIPEIDLSKDDFLDEELRLFFVALSRSKENLFLSYVSKFSQNKLNSKKSKFLDLLNLNITKYSRELNPSLFRSDLEKEKFIKEITLDLTNSNFSEAKSKIDFLMNLESKQSTLNNYLNDNSKNLIKYKKENKDNLQINSSKMVFSVSQLKTYEQCPKKYLFNYIYKIPTTSKHYFDFGTSIHEVLEKIEPLSKKLSKKELTLKALSVLSKSWISKSYESADQEKEYFEKGVKAIKDFINKELEIHKTSKTISLEKEFWLNLDGRRLMGYIDRIVEKNGEVEILDYKTSNSKEPKSKLKENLQLYTYALALLQDKVTPKRMGLWYLIHDEIDLVDFKLETANKIKDYLLSLIKEIESSNFNPKPTLFNCKFCDYSKICKSSLFK